MMNIEKEIRNAFDQVHAPETVTERMKQELYQKDFHEEAEEITCQAEDAPKRSLWRYSVYVAAAVAICVGCGFTAWNMRSEQSNFNPSTTVPVAVESEEETTEPEEAADIGVMDNEL